MEWLKERIMECDVREFGRVVKKRIITRHRDDGVMYYLNITVGHPRYDTREHIVFEFAKMSLEEADAAPCTERQFDETFLMNLNAYKGKEITDGKFYTFLKTDPDRLREWQDREWSRPVTQRIMEDKG